MDKLLDIKNLKVGFEEKGQYREVINGLDLELQKGEMLYILGDNGCGKTLLCKAIIGLLPQNAFCSAEKLEFGIESLEIDEKKKEKPNAIDLSFDQREKGKSRAIDLLKISKKAKTEIRRKNIAYIPQNPISALDPTMKVAEQIIEVMEIKSKRDSYSNAISILNSLGLEGEKVGEMKPYQLSGGMCQRVCIAIALARNPQIILADEPTTALDNESKMATMELLKKLNKEKEISIIVITHELDIVETISGELRYMENGRLNKVEEISFPCTLYGERERDANSLLKKIEIKSSLGCDNRIDYRKQERSLEINEKEGRAIENHYLCKKYENSYIDESENYPKDTDIEDDKILPCNTQKWDNESCEKLLIRIEGLSKYFGEKKVLDNINVGLRSNEFLAVTGASGSGKTTLIKCIAGLCKYEEGSIIRNTHRLAFIFQDSIAAFNPKMTIKEIIEEPYYIKNRKKLANESIEEVLKAVELPLSVVAKHHYEISGGQRQRVAIARALVNNPELILADEPIASLDANTKLQILRLLKKLQREKNTTIMLISHDVEMMKMVADRIINIGE